MFCPWCWYMTLAFWVTKSTSSGSRSTFIMEKKRYFSRMCSFMNFAAAGRICGYNNNINKCWVVKYVKSINCKQKIIFSKFGQKLLFITYPYLYEFSELWSWSLRDHGALWLLFKTNTTPKGVIGKQMLCPWRWYITLIFRGTKSRSSGSQSTSIMGKKRYISRIRSWMNFAAAGCFCGYNTNIC